MGRFYDVKSSSIFAAASFPRSATVTAGTTAGSTNFGSFGHHSSPFTYSRFLPRTIQGVLGSHASRHWPSLFSQPFSFFDSATLCHPPERRDIRTGERGREGGTWLAEEIVVRNRREEVRWEMVQTRGITSRLWSIWIQWNARSVCYFPGYFVEIAPSRFTSQCHRDLAVGPMNRSRKNERLFWIIIEDLGMIGALYRACIQLGIRDLGLQVEKESEYKL